MITLKDLENVINYGEHTALLELDEDELRCSIVKITDEILDADYYYIYKGSYNPTVYQLLFFTLLIQLKPVEGITDDNYETLYETLKMMKKAKLGLIMNWKTGKTEKYLLLL